MIRASNHQLISNWMISKKGLHHSNDTNYCAISLYNETALLERKKLDSLESIVFSFLSISIFSTASEHLSLSAYKKSLHFISL